MKERIRSVIAALIFLACIATVHAQKNTFTIKPGEKIESVVPDSVSYLYPFFKNGTVCFKDGRRVNARFNYNSLFEEVMFIAPGGDTMALDNGAAIKFVAIDTDTFYFDESFVKNAASYGDIRLASKDRFVIVDVNAVGAMGNNAPSSVTTFKKILTRGESQELTRQEILKIRKETQFYLGDKFNNYEIVSRKSLINFFPGKSKKIKEYLRANTVDFNDGNDLNKMILMLHADQPK